MCSTRWPAATTSKLAPTWASTSRATPATCSRSTDAAAPEYIQRPCLTIGLAVQPEVLQGLAGRPGFRGRGLLARFLYSLPESLVGRRQAGAPPVPEAVADRRLELQALAASLITPATDDPTVLVLDPQAAELLLGFERDLEPRLDAGNGDLAHLAGWAAKLVGATCRLAACST